MRRVADADLTLDLRVTGQTWWRRSSRWLGKQPPTRPASRPRAGYGRQEAGGYAWLWRDWCTGRRWGRGCGWRWGGAYTPPARPQLLARPTVRRHALSPGFLQQLMPTSKETFKIQESLLHTGIKQVNLSIYSLYKFEKWNSMHLIIFL